jgi:uncharacterized phiE125 gp8 family phage protein
MYLKLITAVATEPVTLEEARLHLRLDASGSPATHADDAIVSALITAARQHIDGRDGWLGRALATQTWEMVLDGFPCHEMVVPLPPLQEVVSITYVDGDGEEQTLTEGDDFRVIGDREPAWIVPVYNGTWPTTRCQEDAVRVRFTTGYGDTSSPPVTPALPMPIKQAMLLLIGHWYEHREEVIAGNMMELPVAVNSLLAPYRLRSF